ncbi:hypothetical protein KFK09_023221 [Dendrobium nobile]|uniref:Uncharacterized protein n=1 Tax=Dendrobium nobile TaxID=94219 RepID=A0A8T3AS22_DENNO|nr:hypothetical protein KFK09_023221 [Dendrobium nobile]
MRPNHLRRLSLLLSATGATQTFSSIYSFCIRSLRVKALIHLMMIISATLKLNFILPFKGSTFCTLKHCRYQHHLIEFSLKFEVGLQVNQTFDELLFVRFD